MLFSVSLMFKMYDRYVFISLPENGSFRKDLCFTADVFFLQLRDLRDAWADRHEILHDGQ